MTKRELQDIIDDIDDDENIVLNINGYVIPDFFIDIGFDELGFRQYEIITDI